MRLRLDEAGGTVHVPSEDSTRIASENPPVLRVQIQGQNVQRE